MIVGLTGYAGSGKDTAAAALVMRGWSQVAFAAPLKMIAIDLGWDGKKDEAGRRFLQALGQSVREQLSADVWVDAARRKIESAHWKHSVGVVVTDVRYRNEIDMIHELGGIVVVVNRPGVEAVNDHPSEHDWTKGRIDWALLNDCDPGTLGRRLVELVAFAESAKGRLSHA